jgi:uncharacterized repeat protein (TIGR01451 family)
MGVLKSGAWLSRRFVLAALVVSVSILANSASAAADAFGPQFQVSVNGGTGNPNGTGQQPDIAYNTQQNEHFVVWVGIAPNTPAEIYGQRIDQNGNTIGGPIQLSNSIGKSQSGVEPPTITYNPVANEYLVAWGAYPSGPIHREDVYIQRVAGNGTPIGPDDELISDSHPYSDLETQEPVYSAAANEYFVVWKADNNDLGFGNGAEQIWGQRLAADGSQIGGDIQISQMTGQADDALGLAYNARDHEYLTVWKGFQAGAEPEVYGQRLSLTGAEIGTNDFQISDMTMNGFANSPRVAWNSRDDQYLVGWAGYLNGSTDSTQREWVQLLNATGGKIGSQQTISNPSDTFDSFRPDIAYNSNADQYLVSWHDNGGLSGNSRVIGQYLSAAGAEIGTDDFVISLNPPDSLFRPSVDYNAATCDYAAVYNGSTSTQTTFTQDVFGRRVSAPPCQADVGVTKTGPATLQLGSDLTYTIKVTNHGPSDATGVVVTDAIPAGTTFVSVTTSKGSCTHTTTSVTCNIGTLVVGGTVTMTLRVHPTATRTVTNTARVSGTRVDTNVGNNSATATTRVIDTIRPRIRVLGVSGCISHSKRVRVRITDASALRFARVFVDGKRIKNTRHKSFSVTIRASSLHGSHHTLKVVARDAAGNTRTVTRRFANCVAPHPVFTG